MEYCIRNLHLNRKITVPSDGPATDGTTAIREYRSLVARNELEPPPEAHLADGKPAECIPAGLYLFTQGMSDGQAESAETDWRMAAEAIWLESLWREIEFKNDRIFVRILTEDSKKVFQIFREIVRKD